MPSSLHLKLWDNISTFLIIIVGLQAGQTTVVILAKNLSLCRSIADEYGL
jgi:hypothetical protein